MSYNTVIFDFDLTLANSTKPILTCYEETLSACGYPARTKDEIFKMIGLDLVDGLSIISDEKDEEKLEIMRKTYVAKADEVMAQQTVFFDGSRELLASLREKGVNTAIVTSKFRYRVIDTFEAQNSAEFIPDEIVGRDDVIIPKPDPTGLLEAISRFGTDKKSVLYVGDSFIDAKTAQNAGVNFAGVLTGSTTREMFSEYPNVMVVENIKELAKRIVNNL